MSAALRTAAPALRRLSFTFAADGSHAACLAAGADRGWYAESWRLTPGGPVLPRPLRPAGGRSESLRSQLVSLPDGRVLVCRHAGERHDLVLLTGGAQWADPAPGIGGPAEERALATLWMPGLRLLPLPLPAGGPGDGPGARAPGDEAPVAVALGTQTLPPPVGGGTPALTTAWLVYADGRAPCQVAELPGLHGGGVWLDRAGRLLALDRVRAGVVKTVALDLRLGTVTPLLEIAEQSNDRLLLVDPDTGFLLLRSDAPGEDRLGWGVLGGAQPVRFPDCLHTPGRFLRPVAVAPGSGAGAGAGAAAASRVVVQVDHGASSALARWVPAEGRLEPLAVPPGRFGAIGHWSAAGGLRMPYSAPDHPAALATLDVDLLTVPPRPAAPPGPARQAPPGSAHRTPPGHDTAAQAPPGWRLDGSAAPSGGGRWHGAHSTLLAGPAGPIEAVVYGGAAWSTAPHLVLALHGGPADAWRLEFDPTLQRMAAEGLAVLAPNQRGSTGYGVAHAMAIRGAWGGPDLADVLALLAGLADRRAALGLGPPALFGVSYGAFLALLATAHAPAGQVARCAVVAPFLSGARLLAEAAPAVRALTTRLGGGEPIDDAYGPRDVLRLAHRLTAAPLLVVHGDRDEVVPVGQSRSLRHELLRIGRVEGGDFRYLEAAGAGHEVLAEEGAAVLHELLAGFLRG
ncbi:prolyl oligopeptidase family serine peptidase [Kitasatospora sp. NBC_01287]|uniref:alpha/beta hydrolase family protein n=1 Tax=Kitasatospora sp. NBC_01287 TaxID=2903573 RepID=UPI0022517541|nr:prolyl oligopeptidase family serine peptidase [Kitasatospora sp. NBC_01287]MCX4749414.1 prolyl oligopeptidase family serine peptidase [Kitasatospora sp. NBC_01287]